MHLQLVISEEYGLKAWQAKHFLKVKLRDSSHLHKVESSLDGKMMQIYQQIKLQLLNLIILLFGLKTECSSKIIVLKGCLLKIQLN
jgi:hypothetical protein